MVVSKTTPTSKIAFERLRTLPILLLECCLSDAFSPCGPRARLHVTETTFEGALDANPLMQQQQLDVNKQLIRNVNLSTRRALNIISGISLMNQAVDDVLTKEAVEPLMGELLELKRKVNILYACGDGVEAKLVAKEMLDRAREAFVPEHPEVLQAMKVYANVLSRLCRTEEADASKKEPVNLVQGKSEALAEWQSRADLQLSEKAVFDVARLAKTGTTAVCASSLTKAADAELWARQLQTDGFIVVPSKIKVDIHALGAACHARLEDLLKAVEAAGGDPSEQNYRFAEICHRKRSRWDMRMPHEPAWTEFCAEAFKAAEPILKEISGPTPLRLDSCGVVISRSGATLQSFHADGSSRIFNVFVPLVDIAPDSDGTEFWPGSHLIEPEKAVSHLVSGDGDVAAVAMAPAVEAGHMLIFDYRVQHRGLASIGRERAYAYVAISIDVGTDAHNFPQASVFNATEKDCARMPYWNDGNYRPLDWSQLTANQQHIALRTAWQLLKNCLRMSLNPSTELSFDDKHQLEIKRANEIAQTMVVEYCEFLELDPLLPRSQYQAATSLQAQICHAHRQDDNMA